MRRKNGWRNARVRRREGRYEKDNVKRDRAMEEGERKQWEERLREERERRKMWRKGGEGTKPLFLLNIRGKLWSSTR